MSKIFKTERQIWGAIRCNGAIASMMMEVGKEVGRRSGDVGRLARAAGSVEIFLGDGKTILNAAAASFYCRG